VCLAGEKQKLVIFDISALREEREREFLGGGKAEKLLPKRSRRKSDN
jgi:hypothetical protein